MYRDKWYSIINILGLSVGLCTALLLSLYVKHELSFDRFHTESNKIYRLNNHFSRSGLKEEKLPCTLYDTGNELLEQVSEIEMLNRIFFWDTGNITIDDNTYSNERIIYTDTTFFSLFNFPIIHGNSQKPLSEPHTIVISERLAKKWFGKENPIGKSITISTYDLDTVKRQFYTRPQALTVSAVMQNVPKNSHIQFDIATPFSTMPPLFLAANGQDFYTYLKLSTKLNKQIKDKINHINSSVIDRVFGNYGRESENTKTVLVPLKDIHLHTNYPGDRAITTDYGFVLTLSIIALLVLIIASINFINLTTARADKRKREVGIRKVVGSNRIQITMQFIGESVITTFIALLISFMLLELVITPFNNLLGTTLALDYKSNISLLVLIIATTIAIGILGGIYPSLYMSRFKAISVLRGLTNSGKRNPIVKSILVVLQFGISSALIFMLMVIMLQMRYFNKKDLGFEKEDVIIFSNLTESIIGSYSTIRQELLTNPSIESVSGAQSLPGGGLSGMNLYLEGADPSTAFSIKENRIQDYYIETLMMKIVEGRDFIPNSVVDNDSYIINQSAAKMLGVSNPIGKKVVMWQRPGTIIGVVKDYHLKSLRDEIEPLIISRYNPRMHNFTIRLTENSNKQTVEWIENTLKKHDPNYKSSNYYLSDFLMMQYRSEKQTYKLILSASILAIIISIVGLYALSAFAIARRTKEIGIRKILGSSVSKIATVLIADTTKWVMIANIIAIPVAYFLANEWLNGFAYRISIEVWIPVATIATTFTIALLTIVWQAIKASHVNPIVSLRYE